MTTSYVHQLVGAIMKLNFDRPVSGSFRLPVICNDLRGRFIPLRPVRFELSGVTWIRVEVSSASDRVFEAGEPPVTRRERRTRGVRRDGRAAGKM